jgi:glycosyltransferase involved in cell wall biosynthesis
MPRHIVVFLASLGGGGAERVMVNIGNGLAARGIRVTYLLLNSDGPYAGELAEGTSVVDLNARSYPAMAASFPRVLFHLSAIRPDCVISALEIANLLNVLACRTLSARYRPIVTVHSTLSMQRKRRLVEHLERSTLGLSHEIVAVSQGVADDLVRNYGVRRSRIRVVYNPVDIDRVTLLSRARPDGPVAELGSKPFVLGVGRLKKEKNFGLLLRAYARLRRTRDIDLVILGEGPHRERLVGLGRRLGISAHVHLPGFVANPFAYMSRATVLALTSITEGFALVLVEALACGCPVVATDCPSGPAEILGNGRWGELVPVGDVDALAAAIERTLDKPLSPEQLMTRAAYFSLEKAVEQYYDLLFLSTSTLDTPS